jgi:hypothetical protein
VSARCFLLFSPLPPPLRRLYYYYYYTILYYEAQSRAAESRFLVAGSCFRARETVERGEKGRARLAQRHKLGKNEARDIIDGVGGGGVSACGSGGWWPLELSSEKSYIEGGGKEEKGGDKEKSRKRGELVESFLFFSPFSLNYALQSFGTKRGLAALL